ncbi:hypothetical protein MRB53_016484 [Persea americana]|uniref:Uncharacterized protein n=1 Tax=Persea americana TaxID=3435 RepID=A0ACC2M297_PERAE|nr:hypothetical protein MRB53_016484 [Persea americana]
MLRKLRFPKGEIHSQLIDLLRQSGAKYAVDLYSRVLEIDSVEGAHFPIVNNRQINYNLVAKELTGKPVAWVGGDIGHHKLTESYCLLNIFIRHNVSPKVSKRVTKEDGYLLYCIETQRRVDLPFAVFRGMAKVHNASHNAALPFPGVISKLLVDMGKLAEPNENIIIPKSKIDRFTLEKSRSHITSIELDDDGMPGDDQIGEVAINALNERIERLEVRVNEGFAEMRQGFAEMLDCLRRD